MRIKISQIIDIDVSPEANQEELWQKVNETLAPESHIRRNLDFVVESVDGDDTHPLVDEMVGV